MTIVTYNPAYESAHYTILDRLPHARNKHPELLTFEERLYTVLDELAEVEEALAGGDLKHAMDGGRDAEFWNDVVNCPLG